MCIIQPCHVHPGAAEDGEILDLVCDSILLGRYVIVQLMCCIGSGYRVLSLNEVQVFENFQGKSVSLKPSVNHKCLCMNKSTELEAF